MFEKTELRIGNEDESTIGLDQMSKNRPCGYYEEGVDELVTRFIMEPTAIGRYLTLQRLTGGFLSVNEIYLIILG